MLDYLQEAWSWLSDGRHLPTIGAVIAFLFGVFKYVDAKRRESRKGFLEKQLELYFKATKLGAEIATLPLEATEREAKLKEFRLLYWGELCIVEDRQVEGAMIAFQAALDRPDADKKDGDGVTPLQSASYDLAHACRDSVRRGWGSARVWSRQ